MDFYAFSTPAFSASPFSTLLSVTFLWHSLTATLVAFISNKLHSLMRQLFLLEIST